MTFIADKKQKFSESKSAKYSFILGNTQLMGKYGLSKTVRVLPFIQPANSQELDKRSTTENKERNIEANRLMFSHKGHKMHLRLGHLFKDTQVTTLGVRTDGSAQKFNIIDGALSYAGPVGGGNLSASLVGRSQDLGQRGAGGRRGCRRGPVG